jgi:type II secretory pathway pseudopilin PulG
MSDRRTERGTTLVEAIIAIGILAGGVVALAGLAAVATRNSTLARERSVATILALQKMEALCRDVSSLPASPANAWAVDTPGYVEFLDPHGAAVGARGGGAYVRRWSIAPLPSDANLLAIQVDVAPCRTPPGASQCGDVASHARLASIRSRAAW